MEIINLKTGARVTTEQVGNNDSVTASDNSDKADVSLLKITDIKQAVKNENRVNIFINGKYSFSLDIAQLVDLKVKVGRIISEAELSELKRASEFGKLYQRALEWVLVRPRSEKETRDYLYRKIRNVSLGASRSRKINSISSGPLKGACPSKKIRNVSSGALRAARPSLTPSEAIFNLPSEEVAGISQEVIARLKARGYLDDEKFAKWYVENRFVKKGVSKKRLEMELMKKGVKAENIEEFLGARDEKEEILKIIEKKRNRYDDEKLILYLVRQGFSLRLAREMVQNFGKD